MTTRGISEVPGNLNNPALSQHLQDLRQTVLQLRGAQTPPRPVTNLKGTAMPGASLIQWTATDADYYELAWNTTPSQKGAQVVESGIGSQYQDNVGDAGVTRWYWVRGRKNTGSLSPWSGPVQVTTAPLGVGVSTPTPPPVGDQIVKDATTGFPVRRGPLTGA